MRIFSVLAAATASSFLNTNAGSKVYICATAKNVDLAQSEFEGLTWVQVKAIGNFGETGTSTNVLSYDTWDTEVTQKAKGISNAGDPVIEVARLPLDPGQIILRNAAKQPLSYAIKIERNDKATEGGTGTILYNRGIVTGPKRPNGRNEDFDLEMFTLGLNQIEIVVDPDDA